MEDPNAPEQEPTLAGVGQGARDQFGVRAQVTAQ